MNTTKIIAALAAITLSFGCADAPGPVHMTEVECRLNSDCEVGSYCDSFTNLCGWDCQSDAECEPGMYCETTNGRCLREEAVPIPMPEDGTTLLHVEYAPRNAILHLGVTDIWQRLGTVTLSSFGGDSIFRGIDIHGANFGLLTEVTLAHEGRRVGEITEPIVACGCGALRLLEPYRVPDSESITYEVWGRTVEAASTSGVLTFGLSSSMDADAADMGEFSSIVTSRRSEFHTWQTSPHIIPRVRPTSRLVNDVGQDLYSFTVSSNVPGRTLYIGSLNFGFGFFGSGEPTVSDIRLRAGSTELPPGSYYLVNPSTGERITASDELSFSSSHLTIVFTSTFPPIGLSVPDAGIVLTLVGTPSGFESGEELYVHFGDRLFSDVCPSFSGNITEEGQLACSDGREVFPLTDAVVWTDLSVGGIYTGGWGIENLTQVQILTR